MFLWFTWDNTWIGGNIRYFFKVIYMYEEFKHVMEWKVRRESTRCMGVHKCRHRKIWCISSIGNKASKRCDDNQNNRDINTTLFYGILDGLISCQMNNKKDDGSKTNEC